MAADPKRRRVEATGDVMEQRAMGQSGLKLSCLGFGCWQLGSKGKEDYWGLEFTQANANELIAKAAELGFTYFDSAQDYAGGDSERQLGEALRKVDPELRKALIVGSKIPPNDCTPELLEAKLRATLDRLGVDAIDLYMVHWPISANSMAHFAGDHKTKDGGRDYAASEKVSAEEVPPSQLAFKELARLQGLGLIKHVGTSNFGVSQLEEAMATGCKISVNQVCYNLIFRAAEFSVLPFCQEHGIGVACYSPLMQGLLTGRYKSVDEVPTYRARTRHFSGDRPKSRHGEPGHEELLFKTLGRLEEIAAEAGRPLSTLALTWPLQAHAAVGCVIVGATRADQLASNASAVATPIPEAIAQKLLDATEELKAAMGTNLDLWQGGNNGRVS